MRCAAMEVSSLTLTWSPDLSFSSFAQSDADASAAKPWLCRSSASIWPASNPRQAWDAPGPLGCPPLSLSDRSALGSLWHGRRSRSRWRASTLAFCAAGSPPSKHARGARSCRLTGTRRRRRSRPQAWWLHRKLPSQLLPSSSRPGRRRCWPCTMSTVSGFQTHSCLDELRWTYLPQASSLRRRREPCREPCRCVAPMTRLRCVGWTQSVLSPTLLSPAHCGAAFCGVAGVKGGVLA
jgi:hypothetical protein